MFSWVDGDPSEEPQYQYPEQPSSDQFEQQEQYKEGKYNMNNLSLLNTYSYCILILYAYKDFPSHFISFIYIPWVAFWLVVLGAALQHDLISKPRPSHSSLVVALLSQVVALWTGPYGEWPTRQ